MKVFIHIGIVWLFKYLFRDVTLILYKKASEQVFRVKLEKLADVTRIPYQLINNSKTKYAKRIMILP